MSCCAPKEWTTEDEVNGECHDCGQPTVDGESYEGCSYSPKECETCGYSPCELAC